MGNDSEESYKTVTSNKAQFNLTIPSRADLSVNPYRTRLRLLGQFELLRREHFLITDGPSSIVSSYSGSLLLDKADVSFSHQTYALSINASFRLTPNFLSPGSYATNVSESLNIVPIFRQRDSQFRLFNLNGQVSTDFLSLRFKASVSLKHLPNTSNLIGFGTNLLLNMNNLSEVVKNYTLNTLGADASFKATLRLLGIPITYISGKTNILGRTHIIALGATYAPAGTLFSLTAPLAGATAFYLAGRNNLSGRIGLLPLISPSAISNKESPLREFPVYGYANAEFSRSFSSGRQFSIGAEAYLNIGETLQPEPPSTNFKTLYDQYHGTYDQKAPAQANIYLKGRF